MAALAIRAVTKPATLNVVSIKNRCGYIGFFQRLFIRVVILRLKLACLRYLQPVSKTHQSRRCINRLRGH